MRRMHPAYGGSQRAVLSISSLTAEAIVKKKILLTEMVSCLCENQTAAFAVASELDATAAMTLVIRVGYARGLIEAAYA